MSKNNVTPSPPEKLQAQKSEVPRTRNLTEKNAGFTGATITHIAIFKDGMGMCPDFSWTFKTNYGV